MERRSALGSTVVGARTARARHGRGRRRAGAALERRARGRVGRLSVSPVSRRACAVGYKLLDHMRRDTRAHHRQYGI